MLKDGTIVPLLTDPNDMYSSTFEVNGKKKTFYFFLRYNTEADYWVMDILDQSKNPILNSIPLIMGINIFEQYEYLKIGRAYIVKTDDSILDDIPNDKNLGSDFVLIWGDNE
jgi:hypothetical protein